MGLRSEGLQGTQRPQPLAGSICSTGAAPICPGSPPPARSPPLCPALLRCKSYRFQWCRTANPTCNLGRLPTAWPTLSSATPPAPGESWASPHPRSRLPSLKKPGRGVGGGGRTQHPRDPLNIWGYLWQRADAMPGWFLISCGGMSIPLSRRAGCKLTGSSLKPGSLFGGLYPHATARPGRGGMNAAPTSIRVGLCPVAIL